MSVTQTLDSELLWVCFCCFSFIVVVKGDGLIISWDRVLPCGQGLAPTLYIANAAWKLATSWEIRLQAHTTHSASACLFDPISRNEHSLPSMNVAGNTHVSLFMGLFLVIKTLSQRTWKLKTSHTSIHHVQSLEVSVNVCLVRTALLKWHSATLQATPSLLNLFLYTHPPPKPKTPTTGLKLEKQLTLYSFMNCVHHLHLVLPCSLISILFIKYTVPTNTFIYIDTWLGCGPYYSTLKKFKGKWIHLVSTTLRDHTTSGRKIHTLSSQVLKHWPAYWNPNSKLLVGRQHPHWLSLRRILTCSALFHEHFTQERFIGAKAPHRQKTAWDRFQ